MNGKPLTVGFAGLTHCGMVAALAAATKGARVLAFDPDMTRVARLKRGDLPVVAPALTIQAADNPSSLDYTATAADLSRCDVIYICADVPVSDKGRSDLALIRGLLGDAAAAARPDAVLVVSSPVPPGFCRANAPGGRALHYQLETLAFDEAVERAASPHHLIIGCADPAAPLPAAFQRFLDLFACPVLPMRYESAEFARFSIGLSRVAADGATKSLTVLCAKAGGDWSEVLPVLARKRGTDGLAHRAASQGLERDLAVLRRLAEAHDVDASLFEKWLAEIREQQSWVLQRLEEHVLAKTPDACLGVLGLARIAGSTSTEDSPALALLASLPQLKVRAYDPAVPADPKFHDRLEAASDALDACREADAVVIMTPWPDFASLDPAAIAGRMRGRVVIDPYRMLDGGAARRAGLAHHVPGGTA